MGISFTLTQKTIYLLTPILFIFFIWTILSFDKKLFFKRFWFSLIFSLFFWIPVLILFLYFFLIGGFHEFFQWNYVIALIWKKEILPWDYMLRTLSQNSPYWIFGLGFMLIHFFSNLNKWKNQPDYIIMHMSVFFLFIAMLEISKTSPSLASTSFLETSLISSPNTFIKNLTFKITDTSATDLPIKSSVSVLKNFSNQGLTKETLFF